MSKLFDKNGERGASLDSLSKSLSEFVSRETLKEGLLADLSDIQEICFAYLEAVAEMSKKKPTPEEFEDFLDTLENELLEHLPFHIRSLKKLLPKAKRDLKKAQKGSKGRYLAGW